jgi:crotonobetainyl-CoA:carnitine CoA-transferase CaiB-like acyl-CoA transferase
MTASLPLEGIKVVEIAQALAGPFAGEILAHLRGGRREGRAPGG